MNPGKITEVQCKRSVLKWLPECSEQVVQGAGIGCDYGAVKLTESSQMVSALTTVALPTRYGYRYAFWKALNKLAASGAEPQAIMVNLLLPARGGEDRISSIIKELSELCKAHKVDYLGGHTELLEELRAPVITVAAYGLREMKQGDYPDIRRVLPGQGIVMVGCAALETTAMLVSDYEERLRTRYSASYLQEIKAVCQDLSLHRILQEAQEIADLTYIHDLSSGGVFAGLWELGEGAGCGIEASLKQIPIKQETIEACDFFDINPYMTYSGGSVLVVTSDEDAFINFFKKHEISANRVGQTTAHNDRIVWNGNQEDIRYLTPPKGDDALKIYRIGGTLE